MIYRRHPPLSTVQNALLREKQSVLCIVNRKEDARILAKSLPEDQTLETYHSRRHFLRQLQSYTINISRFDHQNLLERDYIHPVSGLSPN